MFELSSALMSTLCAVGPNRWKLSFATIGAKMTMKNGERVTWVPVRPRCTRLVGLVDAFSIQENLKSQCRFEMAFGSLFWRMVKRVYWEKSHFVFFLQERMTFKWTNLFWEQKIYEEPSFPTTVRISSWQAKALSVWWENLGRENLWFAHSQEGVTCKQEKVCPKKPAGQSTTRKPGSKKTTSTTRRPSRTTSRGVTSTKKAGLIDRIKGSLGFGDTGSSTSSSTTRKSLLSQSGSLLTTKAPSTTTTRPPFRG